MLGSASSVAMGMLPAAIRGIATSAAAASAAPAVATRSSGSIAAMFGFGGSSRIDVPLSEALPSAQPIKASLPTVAPKLETASLDAGLKVAAIDSASPISSVALAIEAGSAYESDSTLGASKVLEAMAFKATANRTTFRLTRELEKIGATATVKAGRESTVYSISAVKMHTPEAVEMLVDSVLNAKLNYWEVAEAVDAAKASLAEAAKDPRSVLTDVLHRAAFDGSLGQPVVLDPSVVSHITNATLKEYVAATLAPSKAVLAASGVTLDSFTQLANPLVAASAAAPTAKASAQYVGGSLNVIAPSDLTYVALAFEAKGGLSSPKAAAAAAVARVLLDGSRSALPYADRDSEVVKSTCAFTNLYKSTGLVGVCASGAPAQADQLVDAVVKKVEGVAKGVSEAQLKLAKQVAISSYKASLAGSAGLAGVIAEQVLLAGKFSPAEFVAQVEGLTAADVSSFVAAAVKSAPTFVTYGNMSKVPRYDSIAKRFA